MTVDLYTSRFWQIICDYYILFSHDSVNHFIPILFNVTTCTVYLHSWSSKCVPTRFIFQFLTKQKCSIHWIMPAPVWVNLLLFLAYWQFILRWKYTNQRHYKILLWRTVIVIIWIDQNDFVFSQIFVNRKNYRTYITDKIIRF